MLQRTPLRSQRPTTKPSILPGMRIYAVGDIHGRADLLLGVFARIEADLEAHPGADSMELFVGDYIDRGPNSRRVIDLLIARKRVRRTLCLKGNHELCLAQVLTDDSILAEWQQMGGTTTLLSYGVALSGRADSRAEQEAVMAFRRTFPENHRRFIEGLTLSFTCGDFFFAHAGVRPGIPLQLQSQQDLLWIRDDFLVHEEDFGKVVVHGHTPARVPDVRPNRINIDTGAYATGRLTCLVLERDEMEFL